MRVAKIVAIANQKGGVGKTTTAVNLSSCVSALGKKVLIVDLDPQGNTTTGYGIPKRSVECGTYEVLIGKATAAQAIRKTEFRTDVIPILLLPSGSYKEILLLKGLLVPMLVLLMRHVRFPDVLEILHVL